MAVIHVVDGQVFQLCDEHRIRREVRDAYRWQVTDAFLADDDVSGQHFAVVLLFVDDGEILVRQ